MTEAVASAKTSGGALLAEADKLGREAAAVESKAALVEQFLEQYQLTPEEVRATCVCVCVGCVCVCVRACVCMCARACMCMHAREMQYHFLHAVHAVVRVV
jgi:hypothetical protein